MSAIERSATATVVALLVFGSTLAAQANPYDDLLLQRVRTAAQAIPGELPRSVRYLAFAEGRAPLSASVAVPDTERITVVFPVFQVRFRDRWIMVDAGFDRPALSQFVGDWSVTYWQGRYDSVQIALRGAERIVLTHEHWDHAAGVERSTYLNEIAPKVLLTRAQLASLLEPPVPHYLRLPADSVPSYQIVEFELLRSLAPGVVLIRAAGHSPGSQMVFVRLASGEELILVGDLVWNMAGLERNIQRPEATSRDLGEDREAVQRQIDWVRRITADQSVVAVPCHDKRWLEALTERGLMASGLELNPQ